MDDRRPVADMPDEVLTLAKEFVRLCRAHERPAIADFASRHPEHEAEINDVFPIMAMLERAGSLNAETNAEGRFQTFPVDGSDDRLGHVEEAADADLLPGSLFGRYRILEPLGRGGMGVVYRATDTELDREVALKIPAVHRSDAITIERFRREARAMATVSHRNLCPVFDAGEVGGKCFLSMAFIRGRTLADLLLAHSPFSNAEAAAIVLKLAEAMDAAHAAGVVHRDLKPANIIMDPTNEPVITDFGLAIRQRNPDPTLTRAGAIVGSPAYMSPEQVLEGNSRVGPASDIYSLGVILYELLSGRRPYEGTVLSVLGQIVSGAAIQPLNSLQDSPSAALERIRSRAMARVVTDRYSSAKSLADDLREFLQNGDQHPDTQSPILNMTVDRTGTRPGLQSAWPLRWLWLATKRRIATLIIFAISLAALFACIIYNDETSHRSLTVDAVLDSQAGLFLADGPPLGNRSFVGTTGNRFTIGRSDILITALGFEDPGNDGLILPHSVSLWDASGESIATVTVPPGRAARFVNGWRYVDISPVRLTAGTTYVLGAETTQHDDFFTDTGESAATGAAADAPGSDFLQGPWLSPDSIIVFRFDEFGFPDLNGGNKMRWAPANAAGTPAEAH